MMRKSDEERFVVSGALAEIKSEMDFFEKSMSLQKGRNLEFAYQSIFTIKPTSVESEKVFSTAGSFCTKFRSSVFLFRKSTNANRVLQKYSTAQFNKEYKLILDCRTRWSRLCDMLDRFYMLKDCILKAQIDLQDEKVEKQDFVLIKELVDVLIPIKTAVEVLCRRDSNLVKADGALCALLDYLAAQDTGVARLLKEKLIVRLKERRMKLTDALKYLQTGDTNSDIHVHFLTKVPTKLEIAKIIESALKVPDQPTMYKDDLVSFLDELDGHEVPEAPSAKRAKT